MNTSVTSLTTRNAIWYLAAISYMVRESSDNALDLSKRVELDGFPDIWNKAEIESMTTSLIGFRGGSSRRLSSRAGKVIVSVRMRSSIVGTDTV